MVQLCLAWSTSSPSSHLTNRNCGLVREFSSFPHQAHSQTPISHVPGNARPLPSILHPYSWSLHVLEDAAGWFSLTYFQPQSLEYQGIPWACLAWSVTTPSSHTNQWLLQTHKGELTYPPQNMPLDP